MMDGVVARLVDGYPTSRAVMDDTPTFLTCLSHSTSPSSPLYLSTGVMMSCAGMPCWGKKKDEKDRDDDKENIRLYPRD